MKALLLTLILFAFTLQANAAYDRSYTKREIRKHKKQHKKFAQHPKSNKRIAKFTRR